MYSKQFSKISSLHIVSMIAYSIIDTVSDWYAFLTSTVLSTTTKDIEYRLIDVCHICLSVMNIDKLTCNAMNVDKY